MFFPLPGSLFIESQQLPHSIRDVLLLIGYSFSACNQNITFYWACQLLLPNIVNILQTIGIPLMFIVQYFWLSSLSYPVNIFLQLLGMVFLIVTNVGLPLMEIVNMVKLNKRHVIH